MRLQQLAGNRAVAGLIAPNRAPVAQRAPAAAPVAVQRQVAGSFKTGFTFPDWKVGDKSFAYAKASLKVGGAYECEVTPAGGESAATSVSGGPSLSPDASKYQVEVKHKFSKIATDWFGSWTPEAEISGDTAGEYKLGLAGVLGGEDVDFSFGFSFLEADGKGSIEFAKLDAVATLKTFSFDFVAADGTKVSASVKPKVTLAISPDYAALLRFFLQRCAAVVTSELALVGGVVLGGAGLIAGYILTLADGEKIATIVDQAVIARRDYINGFMAGITPGSDYAFDNDYKMEGHNRGSQWLSDLKTGVGKEGMPVPVSVIREKVAEHQASARAAATAAVNAYLHQLLVQQYWEIHWGRKFFGYPMETIFLMLMEDQGFGRPGPHATGEEPAEDVAIPAP
jgi:hypothetical protein